MKVISQAIRNWLLTKLTCSVDLTKVLQVKKEQNGALVILLDNQKISDAELKQLKAEVGALQKFKIWSILQETVKFHAREKGFTHSTNWEQCLSGKLMVHNLGIMQSIVDVIDKTEV